MPRASIKKLFISFVLVASILMFVINLQQKTNVVPVYDEGAAPFDPGKKSFNTQKYNYKIVKVA